MVKYLLLLLFVSVYAVEQVEDLCHLEILTPCMQCVKTRKIRLDNGLEAYLISDPDCDQSGAALSVDVGTWQDPEEFPGQAHFTEHLLFLGNEEFPEENNLRRFLDLHGGASNAYTSPHITNFMFRIDHEGFDEALQRFAAMFKAPLLRKSSMSREQHAVDQEFTRAIENDFWRQELVLRHLNNVDHPDSGFGMGNVDTLDSLSSEAAHRWFNDHYSANLMHLVVYSDQPLDLLQELVVTDFSAIPDRKLGPFVTEGHRRSFKTEGKVIYIEPYQSLRELTLTWELPYDHDALTEAHAANMISFILGHEGAGSLLALLKEEGLATGLSTNVSAHRKYYSETYLLDLHVSLTRKGVEEKQKVLDQIFSAVKTIQTHGVPYYIYDEVQTMGRLAYQYQSRSDVFALVSTHAQLLTQEPLETYPLKTIEASRYDAALIAQVADQLTLERARILLNAPADETGITTTETEPYMGVAFALATASDIIPAKGKTHLPVKNRFMPSDLAVRETRGDPLLIASDDYAKIYYAGDNQYHLPEVAFNLHFKSQAVTPGDARKAALLDLYIHSIREALNQTGYEAHLAGLGFDITPSEYGLIFTLSGFSEKAENLFETVLRTAKDALPSPQNFEIYKDYLLKEYENEGRQSPVRQAGTIIKSILYRDYITPLDKLDTLQTLSLEDLTQFSQQFFERTFVEGILFGNLTKADAQDIAQEIRHIQAAPYEEGLNLKPAVAHLPQKGPYTLTTEINAPGNAALLVIEEGPFTFKRRAAQQILASGIEEPFFSELRTHQQTGYVAWSWSQEIAKELFQFFTVESAGHDGRDLLARFEEFIELFIRDLDTNFPLERFEKVKASLINKLQQPPKNPTEMSAILYELAFVHDDLDFLEKRVQGLHELSYEEFKVLAQEYLGKANKQRLAILMDGKHATDTLRYKAARSVAQIRRHSDYQ